MEFTSNDFSFGLFAWQLFMIAAVAFVLYVIFRLLKKYVF